VEKTLDRNHTSLSMRKFTMERSPMSAISVQKPLARSHTSANIRPLAREEPLEGRAVFSEIELQETSENSHMGKS
jgi:hypothetical protein